MGKLPYATSVIKVFYWRTILHTDVFTYLTNARMNNGEEIWSHTPDISTKWDYSSSEFAIINDMLTIKGSRQKRNSKTTLPKRVGVTEVGNITVTLVDNRPWEHQSKVYSLPELKEIILKDTYHECVSHPSFRRSVWLPIMLQGAIWNKII